jgi:S-adenosyl-L-methionine hydrolase (adenosine-forming)
LFTVITFLTDFGLSGPYVAACEAVLASLAPSARVLHFGHEVAPGDVREGSLVLAQVAPLAPPAVHLAVVDPGVGGARHPIAIHTERGDYLVGPDNGLLTEALAALGGHRAAWSLVPARVRGQAGLEPAALSSTFHGRDLFAPAAALLARGLPPATLGDPFEPADLVRLPPPLIDHLPDGAVQLETVEVDRFGNVAVAGSIRDLPPGEEAISVWVEGEEGSGWRARRVATFGQLAPGELGILEDSWGRPSLCLNGASAAELLGVRPGALVLLRAEPS